MKKIFLLFFSVITGCISFSQNILEVDFLFKIENPKFYMKYYKDSTNIETPLTIRRKTFRPYNIDFPGLNNTKFWFRLQLENSFAENEEFIYKINTVAFDELKIYKEKNGQLEPIYVFTETHQKEIDVAIKVALNQLETYYFEVLFTKSIYFPIKVVSLEENTSMRSERQVLLGLFYGFSLVVLLINIFFYINTKNKFFLYYCFLLLSIVFTLFELDGLCYTLFGNADYIKHIAISLHLCLVVSLMLFTNNALKLDTYFPKIKYIGIPVIIANAVSFIVYVFTDDLLWYTVGEGFNTIALCVYWFSGMFLFKKQIYARFLVIGYTIIFISNIIYVLPSEFGMADIGFTDWHFKIGSAVEMIVFLYAISYRHKTEEIEKIEIATGLKQQQEIIRAYKKTKEATVEDFFYLHEFTKREREVFLELRKGDTNGAIAKKLKVKLPTVKYHVKNILVKLDVKNRTEASKKLSEFKIK